MAESPVVQSVYVEVAAAVQGSWKDYEDAQGWVISADDKATVHAQWLKEINEPQRWAMTRPIVNGAVGFCIWSCRPCPSWLRHHHQCPAALPPLEEFCSPDRLQRTPHSVHGTTLEEQIDCATLSADNFVLFSGSVLFQHHSQYGSGKRMLE